MSFVWEDRSHGKGTSVTCSVINPFNNRCISITANTVEQVFIRNIFAIYVPFSCLKKLKPETLNLHDTFGFQLHDQKSNQHHTYNLEL